MRTLIIFFLSGVILSSCSSSKNSGTRSGFNTSMVSLSTEIQKSAKKNARRTSKQLSRQGFYPDPLGLPISDQLEKAYLYESVLDQNGQPRYLVEKATVLSRTHSSGKQHAIETCKLLIAGYLQSHLVGLVKSELSNDQLSVEEAESINKMVSSYENWIVNNLGPVQPIAVLYNDKKGGLVEVSVSVAYDKTLNLDRVRSKTLRKLEKDTELTRERLEEVFSHDRVNQFNNQ